SGQVLTSSTAIVHYLDMLHPQPVLIGDTPQQRAEVMDLDWRIENEGFMAVGEAFRNRARSFANNALTGKHEFAQIPDLVSRGAQRTVHFFEWLNDLLAQRQYIAGERFTLADITAFVTVEFAGWIKQTPAAELVHLQRWLTEVSARESARV
ncbi:MAG: glutathione S-transferase C-terminal domain-containing protein, partial [Pseudomonadota bacterium]